VDIIKPRYHVKVRWIANMLQVKTFNNIEELNNFIRTIPEESIHEIEWSVIDGKVEITELFMVVYKVNI
jgi:hypothetical protein